MGLYVNTNVASMNAQRNLMHSQNSLGRNFARFSSGLRITNAGDDAAGLAISECFTSEIRGLGQALRNANDAISLAQLAESALSESTNILQRMRELSVQAASDINNSTDRRAINDEIIQLKDELTRIGDNTSFNGTKLLDGSFVNSFFQVGAFARQTVQVGIRDARSDFLARQAVKTGNNVSTNALAGNDLLINGITVRATVPQDDSLSTSFSTGSAIAKANAINDTTEFHGVTARAMPTEFVAAAGITAGALNETDFITINGQSIVGFDVQSDDATHSFVRAINAQSPDTGVTASLDNRGHLKLVAEDGRNIEITTSGGAGAFTGIGASTVATASLNIYGENQYQLSGANESFIGFADNDFIGVNTNESINNMDVLTRFTANESILRIDRAIAQLTSDRAELGAVSNRMQSTISNLSGVLESSEQARSRIRDADFAAESASLAKNNVLQQAGVSILSQANAAPQAVLSLLQGG
jgi:flagellin